MLSRMKFEIEQLVAEILDQLPADLWTSTSSTFFDPAIGGGQFVRAIESRLRAAGHSDSNIRKRVFGFEASDLHIRFAVNKHGLVGQYAKKPYDRFLELDDTMKFDVVVGNPPYQSGNGEKGGKHSLWRKFVKKGFNLVRKNGFISFVCPGFPYQANDLSDKFTKNTPLVLINDASHHFPGVGSDIKYWIVKEGKHNLPFFVDGQLWANGLSDDPTKDPMMISIQKKVDRFPKFQCQQDKGYNSTQLKNDDKDYFETPTGNSIYPIRHASTIKVCYVSKPTECHNINKVMMTFSGYPDFEYYDGTTNPMSSCYQMSGYIKVADEIEGQALINLYKTKLYTFLSDRSGAGMKGVGNYSLPIVDLKKRWSDAALYQHFGLSQAEIDHVENEIK